MRRHREVAIQPRLQTRRQPWISFVPIRLNGLGGQIKTLSSVQGIDSPYALDQSGKLNDLRGVVSVIQGGQDREALKERTRLSRVSWEAAENAAKAQEKLVAARKKQAEEFKKSLEVDLEVFKIWERLPPRWRRLGTMRNLEEFKTA